MQIKRYEAKNMTAALRMIRRDLGPEAVILSARSIRKGRGFFGSLKYAGVEVTAAIDKQLAGLRNDIAAVGKKAGDNSPQSSPAPEHRTALEMQSASPVYPAPKTNYPKSYLAKNRTESRVNRALSSLYQQILAQEVDRGIASELIDEIRRIAALEDLLPDGGLKSHLVSILKEMGIRTVRNAFGQEKPNIMALIGSTGVGKTTTLAKLATLQTSRHKKRVALITLDNYGIAANEPLKKYAQIIGIPLTTALNVTELNREIEKSSQADLILIDTPGINPSAQNQILELKSLLAEMPNLQTHLVLSAATKENDLMATVKALKPVGVQRLAFTKIDESGTFGNIANVLIHTGLPLSFLSCGRKVPDDIEAGTVQKLVDLIFKFKKADRPASIKAPNSNVEPTSAGSRRTKKPLYYVANKNSDVYHCTDCKWSARIKADNIIQFNSTAEAEAQNFLPCRSCKPDRRQPGETVDAMATRLNLSRYSHRNN